MSYLPRCSLLFFIITISTFSFVLQANEAIQANILKSYKTLGLTQYTVIPSFSGTGGNIQNVVLGYNRDGQLKAAAAFRQVKSYELITLVAIVTKEDDGRYILQIAEVPDIEVIKDQEKRNKVLSAVKDVIGRILQDERGNYRKIDAVSGATRYYERLFATYNFLAQNLVDIIKRNPQAFLKPIPES